MPTSIQDILNSLSQGALTVDQALEALKQLSREPLGFATLDHMRAERCGIPEVIFAPGKTIEQIIAIAERLRDQRGHALISRLDAPQHAALRQHFNERHEDTHGRTMLVGTLPTATGTPIPIITAGTADMPVADEAALTCQSIGHAVHRIEDVGVAGLARLLDRLPELRNAGVVICIAGMEGALPSVLGGLIHAPLIAVPTSTGYGAGAGGWAALLGMLSSCAPGISVVNIDNGYGAACVASRIQRQLDVARKSSP